MSRNVFKGLSFDGVHTYKDLGLYMASYPEFDMPAVQDKWVSIPGRNGLLNLTRALDGFTHYDNRDGRFEFLFIGDKADAMAAYSRLANLLHGQQISQIIWDEDECYYYTGQLEVRDPDYDEFRSRFTVTGDLEPYKYEIYAVGENWLWDSLDFEGGYIRDADDWAFTAGTHTVDVGPMPVCPDIKVEDANSLVLTYTSKAGVRITQTLTETTTAVPGFILQGSCSFTLTGSGTMYLTFRGGSL